MMDEFEVYRKSCTQPESPAQSLERIIVYAEESSAAEPQVARCNITLEDS